MLSGLARKDLFSPDQSPPQIAPVEGSVAKKAKMESPSVEKDTPTFKKILDKSYDNNTKPEVNEKNEKEVQASPQKQSSMKQEEGKEKKEDDIIPSFSFLPNFFFSSMQKDENFQVIALKNESGQNTSKIINELFQKPAMSLLYQNQSIFEQSEETIIPFQSPNFNKQDNILPIMKSENFYSEEQTTQVLTGDKNNTDKNKFITVALNTSEETNFVINNTHNIDDLKNAVKDYFPNTKVEVLQSKAKDENTLDEKNPNILPTPQLEKNNSTNNSSNKVDIKIENQEKIPSIKANELQTKNFIISDQPESFLIRNTFQEQENIIITKPVNKMDGQSEKPLEKNNFLNSFINLFDNKLNNKSSDFQLLKNEVTIPLPTILTNSPKPENSKYDIEEFITLQSSPEEIKAPLKKEDANSKIDPLLMKLEEKANNTIANEKDLKTDTKVGKSEIELKVTPKKEDNLMLKDNKDLPIENGKIEAPKESNFKRNESSMQMSNFENSFKKEEKFNDEKKSFDDKPLVIEKTISAQEKTPIVVSDKGKADFSLPIVSASTRKAIDLSTQLQARGGGTAKVSIQDDKLGQIELNIQMKKDSSVSLEIKTSSKELKTFIENGTDSLKKSLEVQNITLTDVKVSTTEKSSQSNLNSGGHFNSNDNFKQNSDNNQSSQNNNQNFANTFSNQNNQKFFQNQENDLIINPYQTANSNNLSDKFKKVEKNSLTNIQRGANGSIKVLA
ncbi:flagellar hook-length control protein FliK [Fluviispira sanaruensis]|uniref:Flagellar hook-length control protein-like C-terminal domain-containing protein n=1 Tax=Fluviispira sanaruensis TaxID=2493639 RepID=A0A4P2VLS0_FLUSA|nr:flagellar hook-length control protein FliK [Fluviispira sanaruensis]BBH53628.1 hypothetical protein JCM31447_20750 [Fluviispira sanaruensis]